MGEVKEGQGQPVVATEAGSVAVGGRIRSANQNNNGKNDSRQGN